MTRKEIAEMHSEGLRQRRLATETANQNQLLRWITHRTGMKRAEILEKTKMTVTEFDRAKKALKQQGLIEVTPEQTYHPVL